MRRLIAVFAMLAALGGCQHADKLLGPVQTVDGEWHTTQNGYDLSLAMTQNDTIVTGTVVMAGTGGAFQGTITGTFHYPALYLDLDFPDFESVVYEGTMQTTVAQIDGYLDGSGFDHLEMDVHKR